MSRPTPLRRRRLAVGATQRRVADDLTAAGVPAVSRDGLARVELGEYWPGPLLVVALAHYYGASVGDVADDIITGWLERRGLSHLKRSAQKKRHASPQQALPLQVREVRREETSPL